MKIRTKLTLVLLLLSFGVLLAAGVFSTITLDNYFRQRIIAELRAQTDEVEFVLRSSSRADSLLDDYFRHLARSAGVRITLIRKDGVVLFESELPPDEVALMENHLGRPEVQEALRSGSGTSTRRSGTLNIEMLYLAKYIAQPLPPESGFQDAQFLRVGIPLTQVREAIIEIRAQIIAVSAGVLLIVIIVSLLVSKKLSAPLTEMAAIAAEIRAGNLQRRLPVRSHDEIGRLADTLNRMIETMNEDIAKLEKLERVRSEFLGNVSHELRTPIFALQGMLETLLHGALEDPTVSHEFVARALHNARRLNSLLTDLIEISRIESGDMKMSFRYFDIGDLMQQTLGEMRGLADQKRITLTLRAPEPGVEALGDRDRLKQALVNLIDNAIKYTPEGGAVEASFERRDGKVDIRITDNGVGISPEHLARIFERFYRVDKERSREAGGTGLGLAIVKHIIEAHGSSVGVESSPGKGSTFYFSLKT